MSGGTYSRSDARRAASDHQYIRFLPYRDLFFAGNIRCCFHDRALLSASAFDAAAGDALLKILLAENIKQKNRQDRAD